MQWFIRFFLVFSLTVSLLIFGWKSPVVGKSNLDHLHNSPLSPTLTIRFGDQQWELPLHQVGFDGIDPTTLDRQAFMTWLRLEVEKKVNRTPQSAHYKNRELVPHRLGVQVDRDQVWQWLDSIHDYLQQPVELPVIWLQPSLTTDKLKSLKQQLLGSYVTYYNPNNRNRSHNIRLSTDAIDHVVLLPGEIFSFNQVVGPRSIKKGYRPARVIVKGEFSEGIGGGICQTSSTLFNGVDQAGLHIVQRVSHSKQVTYVPKHRDATVSWGGPDFKFQNQLNEPILIVATMKNGGLKVMIYGPKTIQFKPRMIPSS
ncbi:VanW family protein [Hazenella coriacea]|uniref:VanW like protein n=1 Tax=Hazenella coriacea TaxID=1179467 RepID=A0A4R3L6P4_9BACL|nr:VanW family protein [Hazenella coriacea]TCS94695.1 VanW like protein [Hazenella coriacea]